MAPWRCETFKFSTDPQLVAKVTDVVGLYLAPPQNAVVLRVDEKSQIQALDRTAPMLPMQPGLPERRTHDHVRHGTTTLFAALNTATGTVTARGQPRHRHQEFLRFLTQAARAYPGRELHLVMDNYAAHKRVEVRDWLRPTRGSRCTSLPTLGRRGSDLVEAAASGSSRTPGSSMRRQLPQPSPHLNRASSAPVIDGWTTERRPTRSSGPRTPATSTIPRPNSADRQDQTSDRQPAARPWDTPSKREATLTAGTPFLLVSGLPVRPRT